jgi:site-specific DNA-methyltransferase (adenine-specific)
LCRVLKPGAYAVIFAGQRTADLMGIALRLGGFEVRDLGAWQYWSGFPKSHNLPGGLGTALKPSLEPWLLVRVPFTGTVADNVKRWGTGAINIDACRYGYGDPAWPGPQGDDLNGGTYSQSAQPLTRPSQVPRNGIGVFVDPGARWPANVYVCPKPSTYEREAGCEGLIQRTAGELTGGRAEGSAGLDNPRAGAGRTSDGRGNSHSTVKPIGLIRWLQRLVTPRDGLTIDTHCGSGTALIAAHLEGLRAVGCEISADYCTIARARLRYWTRQGRLDL